MKSNKFISFLVLYRKLPPTIQFQEFLSFNFFFFSTSKYKMPWNGKCLTRFKTWRIAVDCFHSISFVLSHLAENMKVVLTIAIQMINFFFCFSKHVFNLINSIFDRNIVFILFIYIDGIPFSIKIFQTKAYFDTFSLKLFLISCGMHVVYYTLIY